jgi:hypothetical protein
MNGVKSIMQYYLDVARTGFYYMNANGDWYISYNEM